MNDLVANRQLDRLDYKIFNKVERVSTYSGLQCCMSTTCEALAVNSYLCLDLYVYDLSTTTITTATTSPTTL
uniref:Uncharacterized protein n=1 Tax=Glossina brevipalpis TaxID=37001 RepID=A0A1A9WHQ4_9MUSC